MFFGVFSYDASECENDSTYVTGLDIQEKEDVVSIIAVLSRALDKHRDVYPWRGWKGGG